MSYFASEVNSGGKKNREYAVANKLTFATKGINTVSLIGGGGAGKTELLRRTHQILQGRYNIEVIQAGFRGEDDERRLSALGIPTHQVNYGSLGFLKAQKIKAVTGRLKLNPGFLFIENPGNLYSPVGFDLGESCRVLVHSVPEGHDQPLKHWKLFTSVHLILVNKIDLTPFTDFSWTRYAQNLKKIRSRAKVIKTSCRTGLGLTDWRKWLLEHFGGEVLESSSSLWG